MTETITPGVTSAKRVLAESNYDRSKISERDRELIDKRVSALELEINNPNRAKYQLRISLMDGASMKLVPGLLSVWKTSSRQGVAASTIHKLYFCPGQECHALMEAEAHFGNEVICARCGQRWLPEQVLGEYRGVLTRQMWAGLLATYVEKLGRVVDLEGRIYGYGIRKATEIEHQRDRRGEEFAKVNKLRRRVYYPFQNLIRDLNNDADLNKRMAYFLNSCSLAYLSSRISAHGLQDRATGSSRSLP